MPKYLYNGKIFPEIPFVDEVAFPFRYIFYYENNYYVLYSSSELYYDRVNIILTVLRSKTDRIWRMSLYSGNDWNELTEVYDGEALGGNPIGTLIWCNKDCYDYNNNTLYMASSDPVPVGGEPEEPEQPETVLTARDLYRKINGKPTKLTLYKKLGGKLVPLDEHTKEVKT